MFGNDLIISLSQLVMLVLGFVFLFFFFGFDFFFVLFLFFLGGFDSFFDFGLPAFKYISFELTVTLSF